MTKQDKPHEYTKNPHIAAGLMKPFIAGARIQLERYLEAQRLVSTYKVESGSYIDRCLYELSSLVEHLSTVATYQKYAGVILPIHKTVADFRNHIRHDVRGEIDGRSEKRAERLGLDEKLQVGIEFTDSGFKIGTTELNANQISLYLDMSEMASYAMLIGAEIKVKGNDVYINPPKED